MAVYKRAGVYINELSSYTAPIADVGSANAAGAVVAAFPQGPSAVTKVSSWYDFKKLFGDLNTAYPATYSVNQFFNNGGTDLYVRRILHTTDATAANNATAAQFVVQNTLGTPTTLFTFQAKNLGKDGNQLKIVLSKSATIGWTSSYKPDGVTASQYTGAYDIAIYRTLNGVDTLLEQFFGVFLSTQIAGEDIKLSPDYAPTVLNYGSNFVTITGLSPVLGTVAGSATVATEAAVGTYSASQASGYTAAVGNTPYAYSDWVGGTYTGSTSLTWDFGSGGTYSSKNTIISEFLPVNQPLVFFFPDLIARVGASSAWDSNVANVYNKYIDFATNGSGNQTGVALKHFVIVETGYTTANAGSSSAAVTSALTAATAITASAQAAVYFPSIYIRDVAGNSGSSIRLMGPSGAVAGLYLKTDQTVGPWKSPAGLTTKIVDAVALEHSFTNDELDSLNVGNLTGNAYYPVNAIRSLPGAGVVVMGARTTKQDGTANRYVAMRRSLTYIEKSLNDLSLFALFESNDEILWSRLKTVLGNFLNNYRNQGGLRGEKADDAFFIKIDTDNNTPATIAAGEVHIEVGVALEYPAEFIVINLSQKTAI